MIDKSGRQSDGVDQAVLAGTALVAVGTANTADGDWDPFDVVTGIILLIILAAFHRPVALSDRHSARLREVAAASITALCCCVMVAWPIQHALSDHVVDLFHLRCPTAAPAARTALNYEAGKLDCASQETSSYLLPALWFVLTLALYGQRFYSLRRAERSNAACPESVVPRSRPEPAAPPGAPSRPAPQRGEHPKP